MIDLARNFSMSPEELAIPLTISLLYYKIPLVIKLKIGNILRYNIKVLDSENNVLYEGPADDASSSIKDMEYTEVIELTPTVMIVRI